MTASPRTLTLFTSFALAACVGVLPARAACPAGVYPVRFVNPPNGALEVARFPVISVGFGCPIPANPLTLQEGITLVDRTGRAVPLEVRRSSFDVNVAIAVPASAADRLDPTSDYALEIRLGSVLPAGAVRTYFRTGGLKSVFCLSRSGAGIWENSCDENYWRADPATGLPLCAPGEPGGGCTCSVGSETVLGGLRATCECVEETDFLVDPGLAAVVAEVYPPAGAYHDAGLSSPLVISLDADLGSQASLYTARIEDVTVGGRSPATVAYGSLTYSAPSFLIEQPALQPDRRYRVTLELAGDPPPPGEPRLLSTDAHRFSWTFNTWTGPAGDLSGVLPTPRTEGVSFPTHLPPWPRLRLLFDGPLTRGIEDTQAPVLEVRRHDGVPAHGRVTWYDADMNRLHLMIYEQLDEGRRYEVFCTPEFAAALGDPGCTSTPVARFLVQVTPPDRGTSEILIGSRVALQPGNERWLAARPAVLNHPHGIKEKYAVDADGPASFLGHVMLVPPAPTTSNLIRVDPSAGCSALAVEPFPLCSGYLASSVACAADADCPSTYSCQNCPAGGNAGCPGGAKRCKWDDLKYRRGLTEYCVGIVGGSTPACSLQDALHCVGGGAWACAAAGRNRMYAASPGECPSGFRLDSTYGCVPEGRTAIELSDGDHHAGFPHIATGGVHFDPDTGSMVPKAPPVVVQASPGASRPTLVTTVPLPATGLPIPVDRCRSAGGSSDGYSCVYNNGICLASGSFPCIPAQNDHSQSGQPPCATDAECFEGFRCDATLARCVIDAQAPGSPGAAFTCDGDACQSEWVPVYPTENVWRLWWPHREKSPGSRTFEFSARIGDAAGGLMQELPLLTHLHPDYDACDRDANPRECVLAACDAWNALDYRAQLQQNIDRLRDATVPAPAGLWAVGRHILLGAVAGPDDAQGGPPWASCQLGQVHAPSGTSYAEMDGPQGLFVKLPPGKVPADYRIEGAKEHVIASFQGVYDLTLRGLTFDGYPDNLILLNSERVTLHGNQFIGSGATAAQLNGSTTAVTVSDNYFRHTSSASQDSSSPHVVTTNNLFWQVQQKAHTAIFSGDMTAAPQVCADDGAECVKPACRVDFDCRIPFLDSSGSLIGDDPSLHGRLPACVSQDPDTGIGSCSMGVVRQGLFMDNVLLDGEGPNNGPWFNFRMQRNHFENVAGQELFDGGGGTHYVSLLDNLDFNSPSGLVIFSLAAVVPTPGGPATSRGLAVENNVIVKNGPPLLTQHHRTGKLRPAGSSAQILSVQAASNGVGLDAAGLRVVENTFVERPGAREWGAGGPGGTSIVNMRDMLVASNTVVSDTPGAVNNYDPWPGNPSSGSFERNLVVATSRSSYADNLCDASPLLNDIRAGNASVTVCDNASARPTPSACPHLTVPASDRGRLFREPIPESPIIDMETLQRHIVATPEDEWNAYRAWPSYDPSLLDDVLQVRAWHPACDRGAAQTGSCTNPDPDDDLYHDARDNCPGLHNPDQADSDGDLDGDGCDDDDDDDGLDDPLDCAPLDPAQGRPDEVASLLLARAGPETARLTWSTAPRADTYDLSRGLLSELAIGSYGICLQPLLTDPAYDDPDVPPAGDGWLYLARGRDSGCGGGGPAGNDSEGDPIPSPCP